MGASLGEDSRFFNSSCCASMLSAMVLEKAPESECDGMVANSTAFSRLVDGAQNITDYLARKLAPAHLEALLRVVISRCPWVLHAQGRKGDLALQRLENRHSAGGPAYA
jgi:hypothetical protein